MARSTMTRTAALILLLGLLFSALPALNAQGDVRYFPETGHTLRGAFRSFWEANGGLGIFGYPITEEYAGPGGRTTQYFERARFELGEVGGRAVVNLGLLGVEVTQGKIFPKVPPIANTADRRYIPETQHIIQYGFKEIWETKGDVRIFGYPISEEIDEILEDGEWHTVQYFERARFEYWPNFPPGERVLLSHLGRRLAPPARTAPGQPAPPAPTPPPAPPPLPASVNASVTPNAGGPGTTFVFDAWGFEPGERVGIWLTAPDQSTFGADSQAEADGNGSIGKDRISITATEEFADGIWSLNAQGVSSKRQAVGYFRVTRAAPQGDPNRLGVIIHDQLPRQGQAFIFPVAAPPGAFFLLTGAGFAADEEVSAWFTRPDGQSTPLAGDQVSRDGDTAEVLIETNGLPEGVYTAVLQGQRSQVLAAAAFRLTRDYLAGPGTPRPADTNGSATPPEGPTGTVHQIRGWGLAPGEPLELWITYPNGIYLLFPEQPPAEADGRIGYNPPLDLLAEANAPPGVYGIHFRGRSSGRRVDVYFTVTGGARSVAASTAGITAQLRAWGGLR